MSAVWCPLCLGNGKIVIEEEVEYGEQNEKIRVMKIKAILSKTTTDKIKSKILSNELAELVFECYITPEEFAKIIDKYFEKEFEIEIKDEK